MGKPKTEGEREEEETERKVRLQDDEGENLHSRGFALAFALR
jgi:hypothetical protein